MDDLQLDDDLDLAIVNGDFAIGDATGQNVELLFKSIPGEWKEHLEAGIAIERSRNGSLDRFVDRTIRVQMKADGYGITRLKVTATGVEIEGSYE